MMERNLVSVAESAGIVGAGGAGFPTHVKLNAKGDTVIINGAECEPLLRVDQELMAYRADALLSGLNMIVEHVGAKQGVVALKSHYKKAVAALEEHLPKYPALSIHQMGMFYPAGDEHVVVFDVTGRIVPEGGIPLAVGVVVSNVETVLNLYDAVQLSLPVTESYVTVTGAVKTPKTVKLPLGVTVREALELAGGATVEDYRVINGGPMMGKVVSAESYVTKTTKGFIVLPTKHPLLKSLEKNVEQMLREAGTACMMCSLCTEVCPRANLGHRLAPHKLMRIAGYGKVCEKNYSPMNAFLCVNCRLCEYACVMGLQPWKLNDVLKNQMRQKGIVSNLKAQPEKAVPFWKQKRYPTGKLITQLGLNDYNVSAPLDDSQQDFPKVTIPLRQGVGAASESVVKAGDRVKKGDLIAQIPQGKLGSNIHASISGTVLEVSPDEISIEA